MHIALKYLLIIFFTGIFGGLINYFLVLEEPTSNKINKYHTFMKSVIIGIGASLLVPLFLSMIF